MVNPIATRQPRHTLEAVADVAIALVDASDRGDPSLVRDLAIQIALLLDIDPFCDYCSTNHIDTVECATTKGA